METFDVAVSGVLLLERRVQYRGESFVNAEVVAVMKRGELETSDAMIVWTVIYFLKMEKRRDPAVVGGRRFVL